MLFWASQNLKAGVSFVQGIRANNSYFGLVILLSIQPSPGSQITGHIIYVPHLIKQTNNTRREVVVFHNLYLLSTTLEIRITDRALETM